MGTTVEKVALAYSVIAEFDSLSSSISCNIEKLIILKVRQTDSVYILKVLVITSFWCLTIYLQTLINQPRRDQFFICHPIEKLLQTTCNCSICTANVIQIVKVGKQSILLNKSTSEKHRILEQEWTLFIYRLSSPTPSYCR